MKIITPHLFKKVLILLIAPFIIVSCGGNNDNPLVGTSWKEVNNPHAEFGKLMFLTDGNFRYERFYGATSLLMLSQMKGTYVAEETAEGKGELKIKIKENSGNSIDESALMDDGNQPFVKGDEFTVFYTLSGENLSLESLKLTQKYVKMINESE